MEMMPGFNQQLMPPGQEVESKARPAFWFTALRPRVSNVARAHTHTLTQKRLKKFMTILDSMTNAELDDST